jgi:chromosome segregation ATPase
MAEASLELLMRQQERVLDELRLVRGDIGDFKADMEVQSAIIRRLDQSIQSLTGELRALAAQQDRQRQRLERLQAGLGRGELASEPS